MIFDGKAFAKEIEEDVKIRISQAGKIIKIVSVIVGDDPASLLYTKLKKAAAERVGIEFEVVMLDSRLQIPDISKEIERIGKDVKVTGVMVQLPLPEPLRGSTPKCLEMIPLDKDVDGLRWEESGVMPATVRAILSILERIAESRLQTLDSSLWEQKFVVLGSRGAVGRSLVHFLRERNVDVSEVEWDTPEPVRIILAGDVVISCVGKAGTVTGEMVKEGVIAIDVGMSQVEGRVVGDMTKEVYQKASLAVPVPGGVGPVTIACLLKNVVDIYDSSRRITKNISKFK